MSACVSPQHGHPSVSYSWQREGDGRSFHWWRNGNEQSLLALFLMGPEGGKRWGEFRESRLQVLYTSGCERDYRPIIQCTHDPLVRKDHDLFTEPPRTLQKIQRTTAGKREPQQRLPNASWGCWPQRCQAAHNLPPHVIHMYVHLLPQRQSLSLTFVVAPLLFAFCWLLLAWPGGKRRHSYSQGWAYCSVCM